jgi:NAD(P)-dependent dehydrogenase (short-subunit alcohol dehydrogenase family)
LIISAMSSGLDPKNHMVFDLGMQRDPEPDEARLALVTGASRGIGLAIARRLAADGYHVVLCARSSDVIEGHAAQLRAEGRLASALTCDLSDRTAIAALLVEYEQQFSRMDVLFNNAGALPTAQVAESVDYDEWDRTLEVNVTAPWYLASRFRRLMRPGSVVVNVASTAAYYPSRGLVAYNVSKAALVMLTRVLALEWARHGVRVVGVAPGKIDTELLAPIKAYAESRNVEWNPQRRVGAAEEVAGLVGYLVSDAAAFITGTVFPIDGGELLVASSDTPK